MYKVNQIAYENGKHWVLEKASGWFEVYTIGIIHSTRCATVHYSDRPQYALERAIIECDRREVTQ